MARVGNPDYRIGNASTFIRGGDSMCRDVERYPALTDSGLLVLVLGFEVLELFDGDFVRIG